MRATPAGHHAPDPAGARHARDTANAQPSTYSAGFGSRVQFQ